jgi:hypothetical protein
MSNRTAPLWRILKSETVAAQSFNPQPEAQANGSSNLMPACACRLRVKRRDNQ